MNEMEMEVDEIDILLGEPQTTTLRDKTGVVPRLKSDLCGRYWNSIPDPEPEERHELTTASSTTDDNESRSVPPAKKRPRRSTVLNPTYWGEKTVNFSHRANASTNNHEGDSSDDDYSSDEGESSDGSASDGDLIVTEDIMTDYRSSRTQKEEEEEKKWKEQIQSDRLNQLTKMTSQRRPFCRESEVEGFFTAALRVKYKKPETPSLRKTLTGGKAGKERGSRAPRKGNRMGLTPNDRLPDAPESQRSVSKDIKNMDPETHLSPGIRQREEMLEEIVEIRLIRIQRCFPEWMFLLKEGFNIMLHGYGSKQRIFEELREFLNEEYLVIQINGLFPGKLKAKQFLIDLCKAIQRKVKTTGSNVQSIAQDLKNKLDKKRHARVFFLVKNLEILATKNYPLFQVISLLAQVRRIHLITYCDHMNSFIGIDQATVIALNLWWVVCPTFGPYQEELLTLKSLLGLNSESHDSKASLTHIFKSITMNAKKAFIVLATLQLEALANQPKNKGKNGKQKAKEFEGISFRELARRCQQSFIAQSDQTLMHLLTEFIDNELVSYTGKRMAMNSLTIVVEESELEEFVKVYKAGA